MRDSGDEEAIGLLNAATDLGEPYEEVVKLAEASGSGPFVALNFLTEYSSPEAHTTLRERERTSDS